MAVGDVKLVWGQDDGWEWPAAANMHLESGQGTYATITKLARKPWVEATGICAASSPVAGSMFNLGLGRKMVPTGFLILKAHQHAPKSV